MKKRWKLVWGGVIGLLISPVVLVPQVQFVLGGAMVNIGYRFQDHLDLGFHPNESMLSPPELLKQVIDQNHLAAKVREYFPRTVRHPKVAILSCMDARIDTTELTGDTRKFYYVLRTAGSVLSPIEQDMLELAISNGVEVLILTRHTDCAAEKLAKDPILRLKFPYLSKAVNEREMHIQEFLFRPNIRERVQSGRLVVTEKFVNTDSGGFYGM